MVVLIHHSGELLRKQPWGRRLLWLSFFLLAAGVCVLILYKVSGDFIDDESSVTVTIEAARQFPAIYLCPRRITRAALVKSGLDGDLAKLVNSVYAFKRPGEISDLESTYETLKNNSQLVLQDVLRDIGASQIRRSIGSLNMEQYGIIKRPMAPYVKLVSFGYCFRLEVPTANMSSLELQYSTMYLQINLEMFREMDGVSFSLLDRNADSLPTQGLDFPAEKTYAILELTETRRQNRNTRKNQCRASKDTHECFYRCVEDTLACNQRCELYSPYKNQSLGDVCLATRELAANCTHAVYNRNNVCSAKCDSLCKQNKYDIFATNRGVKTDYRYSATILVRLKRVESTAVLTEFASVSLTAYIGYAGGCIGFCFGFNVLALLALFATLSGRFRYERCTQQHQPHVKIAEVLVWVIAAAGAFSMTPAVLKDYFSLKTAGIISVGGVGESPKLAICGNWLNETAFKSIMNLSAEFWENDGKLFGAYLNSRRNTDNPPLCAILSSIFNSNPNYESEMDFGQETTQKRMKDGLEVITNRLSELGMDLNTMLINISYDGTHLIKSISDGLENALPYELKPLIAPVGVCYEIKVKTNLLPTFERNFHPITVTLPVWFKPVRNFPCEVAHSKYDGRKLVFLADSYENFPSLDYIFMYADSHTAIKTASHTMKLKSRPSKPCISGPGGGQRCLFKCLDDAHSCATCSVIFLGGTERVYNISNACNRMLPMVRNCFFLQIMQNNKDALWKCQEQCAKSCTRTLYDVSHTIRKYSNREKKVWLSERDQKLEIYTGKDPSNSLVEEFYAYDTPLMLCSIGGIWGIFLGYSYITVFTFMVRLADFLNCDRRRMTYLQ